MKSNVDHNFSFLINIAAKFFSLTLSHIITGHSFTAGQFILNSVRTVLEISPDIWHELMHNKALNVIDLCYVRKY